MNPKTPIRSISLSCIGLFLVAVIGQSPAAHGQTNFADDYAPEPAHAMQTRAPLATQSPRLTRTTLVSGLSKPWALEFLPDGRMLLAELPGRMRIVDSDGSISEPLSGLPPIRAFSSTGLHGLALDPRFEENRLMYFTYHAPFPGESGNGTDEEYAEWTRRADEAGRDGPPLGVRLVSRARLTEDATALEDVEVLLEAPAKRLVFAPDGTLMITTQLGGGDLNTPQQLDLAYGKVMRINADGSIPADNPWIHQEGVIPAIFALGFRDPQGAAIHPETGDLWTAENGPRGGDELNIIRSGRNYGWPVITYGRNYDATPVGEGISAKSGMEQPIYFWAPSIAPSDIAFYTGDLFPEWKGNLFVAALAGEHLSRLVLDGNDVVAEERLFVGIGERIRQVRQGPEGALYLLTDHVTDGRLIKVTRQE